MALFLSHYQKNSGDQCHALALELRKLGYAVWYDNEADDLTTEGMMEGVKLSEKFLLFINDGTLGRWFVQLEVCEALKCKKKVILVYESDRKLAMVASSMDSSAKRLSLIDDVSGEFNFEVTLKEQAPKEGEEHSEVRYIYWEVHKGNINPIPFLRHSARTKTLDQISGSSKVLNLVS